VDHGLGLLQKESGGGQGYRLGCSFSGRAENRGRDVLDVRLRLAVAGYKMMRPRTTVFGRRGLIVVAARWSLASRAAVMRAFGAFGTERARPHSKGEGQQQNQPALEGTRNAHKPIVLGTDDSCQTEQCSPETVLRGLPIRRCKAACRARGRRRPHRRVPLPPAGPAARTGPYRRGRPPAPRGVEAFPG